MKNNRIKSSLYAAAIADALGAPTELRSVAQIKEKFGGLVTTYQQIPDDVFARNKPLGTVTDDFSLSYYLIREINENDGIFNEDIAQKHVITWSEDPIYYENFAGPTTRLAVENLRSGLPTDVDPFGLVNYNSKATNGIAMKVAALGLMAKSQKEAIDYAITLAKPTHYNSTAMSGAAAIAASVYEAKNTTSTLESIIEAGIIGADTGSKYGIENDHISVAPLISHRIREAVNVGGSANSFEDLLSKIENYVGTNIQVTESVPAVYAILAYTKLRLPDTVFAGVNCGGDTDTIATMAAAIAGAFQGTLEGIEHLVDVMLESNETLKIEKEIEIFANSMK
ncbi:ADP-ribosylglycohydrolase family protein [Erysipelothrix anatis]|uniref:ADP-ribosylglycohydrolase family protein n=1 Tax=Erysipelothrix anatis TaxID=2683713 RepID=UPI00135B40C7|nr:ADP-ribosylglycohydrolase family protein [Erysipelothrix anatis]